jgi:hypothetical protein
MSKQAAKVLDFPKAREVDEFAKGARADAEGALEIVRALQIVTAPEYEFAGNALREVAERHDALDDKRKSWVEPLKSVAKDIDATFKPLLSALKEAEETLKEKIGAYRVAMELARAEVLRDASAAIQAGDATTAERLISGADALVVGEVAGVSVKAVWSGEVLDASAIPREFLVPDLAKLEALTKAAGEDPKIPGWRAFPTTQVRTARKGSSK